MPRACFHRLTNTHSLAHQLTAALVGVKAAESARLCATLQLAVRELADRQAALSAEQVQSSMRERPQRVASCDAEAADELAHSTALLRAPLMRGRIVCFMLTHPGHEFVYASERLLAPPCRRRAHPRDCYRSFSLSVAHAAIPR